MDDQALSHWFEARKTLLESAYLAGTQPWQQSGVGLHTPHSAHDWKVLLLLPEHRPLIEQTVSLIRAALPASQDTPTKGNSQG